MAYVITDACIDVKDQSCVQECPVDCIKSDEASNQYFIDPDICIDCCGCLNWTGRCFWVVKKTR